MSNDGERVQPSSIMVGPRFDRATQRPLVWLRVGDLRAVEIPAAAARTLGLNLLRAAEDSSQDALTIHFFRERGMPDDEIGLLLEAFRARREEWEGAGHGQGE